MDNTIKKLLAVLCFLALPILFYEQAVFLIARILYTALKTLEKTAPESLSVRFFADNLPLLYSGSAAFLLIVILGTVYLILKKKRKTPAKAQRLSPLNMLYPFFLGSSGAVFFNLFLTFSRLPELFPAKSSIEATSGEMNLLLFGFVTCFLIPAAEELIFRGMGYLLLRRYMGILSTTLLTAVTFGIFHGNIAQGLYGFFMGILLAFTAERYETLFSVLLFHWAANLTAFFLLDSLTKENFFLSVFSLCFSGAALVFFYYRIKEDVPA